VASCILHIGTHKTGTTALQEMLAAESASLNTTLFYPSTGLVNAGHYNIACELNADPEFQPQLGSLEALIDELLSEPSKIGIVSSENFEHLHTHPDAVLDLAVTFATAGLDTRVVLYVRDQASYIESLYAELVKHGARIGFGAFVDAILDDGFFEFSEGLTFQFEYTRLLAPFADAFGRKRVIVRPYVDDPDPGRVVRDFLSTIGVNLDTIAAPSSDRVNLSASLGEVLRALYENIAQDRAIAPNPSALAAELLSADEIGDLDKPFRVLDAAGAARIMSRFERDNHALFVKFGVRVSGGRDRPTAKTPAQRLLDAAEARWR
jgi:hypothetical protein